MPVRHALAADLPRIVAIYNASIPGRVATADTDPVTIESREGWFRDFDPGRRPLWVAPEAGGDGIAGWLSVRSFYGRPAYAATVELGVYVDPAARRRGVAGELMRHALGAAPALGIRNLLGFVFAHNTPSLALFGRFGFERWGLLPRVAELDGVVRDVAILGLRLP